MVTVTREVIATGTVPPPRLLYTAGEMREIRKLQAIARVEREETAPGGEPAGGSNAAQETSHE
jgi:hypothetical protein